MWPPSSAPPVFGREWSFGHRESRRSGVYKHAPRENEVHSYRESILMGETDLTQHEVEVLVQRMSPRWRGDGYSMLSRNCCHFCDELCMSRSKTWHTHKRSELFKS